MKPFNHQPFNQDGAQLGQPPSHPVHRPPHYVQHPSGVECIQITEHFNFNLGNAIKYIWRAGLKDDVRQDLEKARWYLDRELQRLDSGAVDTKIPDKR